MEKTFEELEKEVKEAIHKWKLSWRSDKQALEELVYLVEQEYSAEIHIQ